MARHDDLARTLPVEMREVVFPEQRRGDRITTFIIFIIIENRHTSNFIPVITNIRIFRLICNSKTMPTTTLHPSGQYYLKIAAKTSKYIDYEQRTVGNEDIL